MGRGWRTWIVLGLVGAAVGIAAGGLDRPIVEALERWAGQGAGRWLAEGAYWAGLGGVQLAAGVAMALAGGLAGRTWLKNLGTGIVVAVAVAGLGAQVIKHLVGRARPGLMLPALSCYGPVLDSDWHSFPSGHTATSFALAVVLASRWPRVGWICYLLAGAVGLGRVAGGSHYPSDVLAGAALGLAAGWIVVRAFYRESQA